MSLKQKKQQDCQQYLANWDDYKKQLDEKEEILLQESKDLVNKSLHERLNLETEFKKELNDINQTISSKNFQEEVNKKETDIDTHYTTIKELQNINMDVQWPKYVSAVFSVGFFLVLMELFEWKAEELVWSSLSYSNIMSYF